MRRPKYYLFDVHYILHLNLAEGLRTIAVHCVASSVPSGGVHHTLTEAPQLHPRHLSSG